MKLISQHAEFWGLCSHELDPTIERIEKAARVCYRSEPAGDPERFLEKLTKPDPPHLSVFEHSNIVAYCDSPSYDKLLRLGLQFKSRWLTMEEDEDHRLYIYGNARAWMERIGTTSIKDVFKRIENEALQILPVEYRPRRMQRVTVKLITDRAILAEITRHRDDTAFSVQSQRYVDYSGEVLYVKPSWFDSATSFDREIFTRSCLQNEYDYKRLRESGHPAQHARVVLSNQVATEIVITAYLTQWDWIFRLRRARGAYPQMIALMDQVAYQFKNHQLLS